MGGFSNNAVEESLARVDSEILRLFDILCSWNLQQLRQQKEPDDAWVNNCAKWLM